MRTPFALGLFLALGGCFSFGTTPPPSLLTLTSAAAVTPATTRSAGPGEAITVSVPSAPQELRTNRVPVRTGATAVAYLKDAQWVEMPVALFGRLLEETIGARTGKVVLDPGQSTLDPGLVLTGQLLAFGIDADRSEAVARYDAALARAGRIETRRFEAHVQLAQVDAASAGPALNQAANQVAVQVADWVAR